MGNFFWQKFNLSWTSPDVHWDIWKNWEFLLYFYLSYKDSKTSFYAYIKQFLKYRITYKLTVFSGFAMLLLMCYCCAGAKRIWHFWWNSSPLVWDPNQLEWFKNKPKMNKVERSLVDSLWSDDNTSGSLPPVIALLIGQFMLL